MRSIILLSYVILLCLSTCYGRDLVLGTTLNTRLVWQQKAEYMGIPFRKRVKEVFYSDPAMQVIRAVVARDLDHTEGLATVTAGGIGFSFVNVRLKSERGSGLNYQIEIYV
ncbi:hypothetical protein RR46_04913 [Papilio xuthus]|uniref:Salivary secreted peptide n=1 Tax=Papilio xuthus TaxID=66420 RepID=I4DJS8_PAPXU|nr:hypothetical protein RR46_04913 [Papilio xuthus]BAM18168.1 unknown secreted protein [Papilio xuthus]